MQENYRSLFTSLGYTILADTAIRHGEESEVHLVLVADRDERLGFIITHDNYDDTYAPMFCEDMDAEWFRQCLEDRIRWFDSVDQCCDILLDPRFWKAHRVGRDDPHVVMAFIGDLLNAA